MKSLFTLLFLTLLLCFSCKKEDPQPQQIETVAEFDTASFLDCQTMSTTPRLIINDDSLSDKIWNSRVDFISDVYTLVIYYDTNHGVRYYASTDIAPDSVVTLNFIELGEKEITPLFCDDIILIE